MNTTQRILSNGGVAQGDWSFLCALSRNNPLCGHHWAACLVNNPGALRPNLNPTEDEALVADMIARLGATHGNAIGCGSLD